MSKKVSWKTGGQVRISIFAVLALMCAIGVIFLWLDTHTYLNTTKISNKEEMFQFVADHLEELDQVVWEMDHYYETSDIVSLNKNDQELRALDNVNELFKKYSVNQIWIDHIDKEELVDISFKYAPKSYDYWGIYYSKEGEPNKWGSTEFSEFTEQDGVYVHIGSDFRYETEKIVGNWYYYQCDAR